jgi:catechol 2,3-dioxygenase-like lactoylglutathione lyase family enzyme
MLHYVTLGTNDLPRARRFYAPVLATLNIVPLQDGDTETAYGPPGAADPALYVTQPYDGQPATHGNGSMLAFTATSPQAVEAFHAAALAHGGTDEGAPGLRYSPTFYACYVRDPDGNKLSAVCDHPDNINLPKA